MRNCIFTDHTRAVLRKWPDEQEIDEVLYTLPHRIRGFEDLEGDVKLYLGASGGWFKLPHLHDVPSQDDQP